MNQSPCPDQTEIHQRLLNEEFVAASDFRYHLRRLDAATEEAAQQYGLSTSHYLLLLHLRAEPDGTSYNIVRLAERMQRKHHSVLGLLNTLEKKGYVRRVKDRAVVHVSITSSGNTLLCGLFYDVMKRAGNSYTAMLAALRRVNDILQDESHFPKEQT